MTEIGMSFTGRAKILWFLLAAERRNSFLRLRCSFRLNLSQSYLSRVAPQKYTLAAAGQPGWRDSTEKALCSIHLNLC
jgi:hypothetical protein